MVDITVVCDASHLSAHKKAGYAGIITLEDESGDRLIKTYSGDASQVNSSHTAEMMAILGGLSHVKVVLSDYYGESIPLVNNLSVHTDSKYGINAYQAHINAQGWPLSSNYQQTIPAIISVANSIKFAESQQMSLIKVKSHVYHGDASPIERLHNMVDSQASQALQRTLEENNLRHHRHAPVFVSEEVRLDKRLSALREELLPITENELKLEPWLQALEIVRCLGKYQLSAGNAGYQGICDTCQQGDEPNDLLEHWLSHASEEWGITLKTNEPPSLTTLRQELMTLGEAASALEPHQFSLQANRLLAKAGVPGGGGDLTSLAHVFMSKTPLPLIISELVNRASEHLELTRQWQDNTTRLPSVSVPEAVQEASFKPRVG
jgi:ribonuclease HI